MNVNDSDPDGEPLTYSEVSGPSHGSLQFNAGGQFRYTPTSGFVGTDTFTYRVSDGYGGTDEATVTIEVVEDVQEADKFKSTEPNDPPDPNWTPWSGGPPNPAAGDGGEVAFYDSDDGVTYDKDGNAVVRTM